MEIVEMKSEIYLYFFVRSNMALSSSVTIHLLYQFSVLSLYKKDIPFR